jgi:hypothetical protein
MGVQHRGAPTPDILMDGGGAKEVRVMTLDLLLLHHTGHLLIHTYLISDGTADRSKCIAWSLGRRIVHQSPYDYDYDTLDNSLGPFKKPLIGPLRPPASLDSAFQVAGRSKFFIVMTGALKQDELVGSLDCGTTLVVPDFEPLPTLSLCVSSLCEALCDL